MSSTRPPGVTSRCAFEGGGDFIRATRADVEVYLQDRATRIRGLLGLYAKLAIAVGLTAASWLVLIFMRPGGAFAAAAIAGLGVGAFLTALCVQHDANHGAFFGKRPWDDMIGLTSDLLLGFSSYAWRVRHNVAHHTYTNVAGHDMDITQEPVLRLAPSQTPRPWHRLQWLYVWPLYALMALRLQTYGDIVVMIRRRVGHTPLRVPKGWHLAALVGGKLVFATWAVAIPMLVYPWWLVLGVYAGLNMLLSLGMVLVFQLAHCVEEASFPTVDELRAKRRVWAVHEVESTVDFCTGNPVLTWALGGLNYQIEHHLFPRVPHTHYPAIAKLVRQNAERYGVRYTTQPSLRKAFGSHVRHLRRLARLGVPAEIEMG